MAIDETVSGSVTHWITQLRDGDSSAAQELWERYQARLISLAHKHLVGVGLRVADEDDVVQSAFATFCHRMELGRFPLLKDRDDLWRMLVVITARKAVTYRRRESAQKRGGRRAGQLSDDVSLEAIVGSEPTPEFAAQATETLRTLLDQLPVESMRNLVLVKLEGLTNEEAAQRLGCSLRTVERRMQAIREAWESRAAAESAIP